MKKDKKVKKVLWSIVKVCFIIGVVCVLFVAFSNLYITLSAENDIVEDAGDFNADCIMVLGCGVKANGTPSDMLRDRLDYGIDLYLKGAAPKMLMSGDHAGKDYDEVNVMKSYAIGRGVPSEDIFMDHAGLSTYDSMYRAKEIFNVDKLIVVTQKYHIYRAIYLAESFGMDCIGVASNPREYQSQIYMDLREICARTKDFIWGIIKPAPYTLGDEIPIFGNGDVTNDK